MRYLAIDYGSKRVGLAICDGDETIASPLCVIEGHKDLSWRGCLLFPSIFRMRG
ncbi:MAG: Holliday junction resolvase RuvX [Planctomycetota bacterium]